MRPNVSELLEKINRIAQQPGFPAISNLEKDLLKQYLRELYAALEDEKAVPAPKEEAKEEPEVKVVVESVQPEELIAAVIKPTEKTEPKSTVVEVLAEAKEESNQLTGSVKTSINEIVKPTTTLNERVKGAGKEIYRQFSAKPLKDMIDLNRKFVFVNDLFDGDSDSFSKAIQHLDTLAECKEALNYTTNSLSAKYNWDQNDQPVKLFYKLIKQKFGED